MSKAFSMLAERLKCLFLKLNDKFEEFNFNESGTVFV